MAVVFSGCKKPDQYPIVPVLEYKSLSITKNAGGQDETFTLTATFTDGDGDIGYYTNIPNDSIFDSPNSPYYYNFVITLSILKNSVWVDTTFNVSARLPYLTPEGQNKGLRGDIEKTDFLPLNLNDTIRFSAFLYDRALHKSNVIETPPIIVRTQ